MASIVPTDGSIANSTNDIPLRLTKLAVSGFADSIPAGGNIFVEVEADEGHRQRCAIEIQSRGVLVSGSLTDVVIPVSPSSLINCELWYESEDKVYLQKLCECTVKVTEAICNLGNACEHKAGKHEWSFELRYNTSVNDYDLPSTADEPAEGLVFELRKLIKLLQEIPTYIPKLSGDQRVRQEYFNTAWQFFIFAYRSFHEAESPSTRAALDDSLKDTLVQLRLGLEAFASRARQSDGSLEGLHWSDTFNLLSHSVIQAAALLDKYTRDLNSASSRIRSLFLDRCQKLQDDTVRYRLMFIGNSESSSRPLDRNTGVDTMTILMHHLVSSDEYDDVFLSLRGRQASRALELLQDVIVNVESYLSKANIIPAAAPNELRQRLRFLFIQVTQLADRIPSSIFLDGVKWNAEVISRTKFSNVNSGVYKKEKVVIKRVKLPIKNVADNNEKAKKALLRTLTWKTLKNDRLLPFIGVAIRKPGKDSDGLHLVAPRMENSDVLAVLKKRGTSDNSLATMVHRWMLEIAEGIAYLHAENVVHGDLRARNILVDRSSSVRITDFGLAALADEAGVNYLAAHPALVRWLAPELLSLAPAVVPSKQTFASDIYAFAGVCLELYTSDVPFANVSDKQILSVVLEGTRPERPLTLGNKNMLMVDTLWAILEQCWNADPSHRPAAAEVVEALTTFIHGEKKPALQGSNDKPEKSPEPLIDEQVERMSTRSHDTDTETSPPDTPVDMPVVDMVMGWRTQLIDTIKGAEGTHPEDIPHALYQAIDPPQCPPDTVASVRDKSSIIQDSSSELSSEESLEQSTTNMTLAAIEDEAKEIGGAVTVDNDIEHDDEKRPVDEHVQTAEQPVTSSITHDGHADTIVQEPPRTGESQDDTGNAPLKEEKGGDIAKLQTIPAPTSEAESTAAPALTKAAVEEVTQHSSAQENLSDTDAVRTDEELDQAGEGSADHTNEEPTAQEQPSEQPVSSELAVSKPTHSDQLAEGVNSGTTGEVDIEGVSPPPVQSQPVRNDSEVDDKNNELHESTSEKGEVLPLGNELLSSADRITSYDIASDDAIDVTSAGAVQASRSKDSEPSGDTPEVHVNDEAESRNGETLHQPAIVGSQESELLVLSNPAVSEPMQSDRSAEGVDSEATGEIDREGASPPPAQSQPVEKDSEVDDKNNELHESASENTEVLPLENELLPSADHITSHDGTSYAAVDATSAEAAQVSPSKDGEPSDDILEVLVNEEAESHDETSHQPAILETQEQEKEAEAAETLQDGLPPDVDVVPATVAPEVETPKSNVEPQDQTASDTHGTSESANPRTPIGDVDEELSDSEFAPPPDLPTADDTVVKRGSIRLVHPPETDALSQNELPSIGGQNGKATEVTTHVRPEPLQESAKQTEIEQETRSQVVPEQQTSNRASVSGTKPTPSPSEAKPKSSKKARKTGEEVPGCKCLVM